MTAMLTLNSCAKKQMTEDQEQIIKHKTDSAANLDHEYNRDNILLELCGSQAKEIRNINKHLVKIYSKDYIKRNIKNKQYADFMLQEITNESLVSTWNYYDDTVDTVCLHAKTYPVRCVLPKQKWFDDLMAYLSDKCDERQLLNSDFFVVINSPELKRDFEYNTKRLEKLNSHINFVSGRKNIVYKELWDKYAKEVQRKR